MVYLNECKLIGTIKNVGEVRHSEKGMFCVISVQTTETYICKDGTKKQFQESNSVNISDQKTYDSVREHLLPGNQFLIEGRLKTRAYDSNGQTRYSTEVVVRQFAGRIQFMGIDESFKTSNGESYQGKKQSYSSGAKLLYSRAPQQQYEDDVPF